MRSFRLPSEERRSNLGALLPWSVSLFSSPIIPRLLLLIAFFFFFLSCFLGYCPSRSDLDPGTVNPTRTHSSSSIIIIFILLTHMHFSCFHNKHTAPCFCKQGVPIFFFPLSILFDFVTHVCTMASRHFLKNPFFFCVFPPLSLKNVFRFLFSTSLESAVSSFTSKCLFLRYTGTYFLRGLIRAEMVSRGYRSLAFVLDNDKK